MRSSKSSSRGFARERSRIAGYSLRASAVFVAMLAVPSLHGQVLFTWPVSTGDVTRYASVEECLAATERVGDSVAAWGPRRPPQDGASLAPSVETARRCASHFPSRRAALQDFALLFELYLDAAQDDDANVLLKRRLAAIGGTAATAERGDVLDIAIAQYLRAHTPRLAPAESLLVEGSRLSATEFTLEHRVAGYANLMVVAKRAGDSVRTRHAAEALAAIGARLTPAEQRGQWYATRGKSLVYGALDYLSAGALLDSLRRSTAAYVTLKRANWTKAGGSGAGILPLPIGELARTLEGEFWFGRGDSAATKPRPTPGKVSLVAFLQHGCGPACDGSVNAVLRRLVTRFPGVELTAVTKTLGFFGETTPLAPVEEAALLRTQLQNRVPGTLIVESTPFARLAAPDLRRLNRVTPNEANYWIGSRTQSGNRVVYLVDQGGTVVASFYLNSFFPDHERELAEMLEILVKR